LLAILLSFLLLGMRQQEAAHSFEHLGTQQKPGVTMPHDGGACATCELLAAGADGVPAAAGTLAIAREGTAVPVVAFSTRAVAAPAAYASRAPPGLS
jgi:hypothetical protein